MGAAAQIGIFATFLGALVLGFNYAEAGSIGIIGGADGPTAIYLTSKLAPNLLGPDRRGCLFLYGFGTGHPTAYYENADYSERARDRHEAIA